MPEFLIRVFPAFEYQDSFASDIPTSSAVSHSDKVATPKSGGNDKAISKEDETAAADCVDSCDDSLTCSVCMCEFEDGEIARLLPCKHVYHAACVDRWLQSKGRCPMCRADAVEMAVLLQSRLDAG